MGGFTFATLNSRSAPRTERQRDGKMNAQYELFSFMRASRRAATTYDKAPTPVKILLFTLCKMKPAITFTNMPAIA